MWRVEVGSGQYRYSIVRDTEYGPVAHKDRTGRVVRYGRRATAEKIVNQLNGIYKPDRYYRERYGESPC